MKELYNNFV